MKIIKIAKHPQNSSSVTHIQSVFENTDFRVATNVFLSRYDTPAMTAATFIDDILKQAPDVSHDVTPNVNSEAVTSDTDNPTEKAGQAGERLFVALDNDYKLRLWAWLAPTGDIKGYCIQYDTEKLDEVIAGVFARGDDPDVLGEFLDTIGMTFA